MVFIIRKFSI